jgi:putative effector of murein hydrolase LrgA (UPF0299 family)
LWIDPGTVKVLLVVVPALIIGMTLLLYLLHGKLVKSDHRKVLAWLVEPFPIRPFVFTKKPRKAARGGASPGTGDQPGTPVDNKGISKTRFNIAQFGWRVLMLITIMILGVLGIAVDLFIHEAGHGIATEAIGGTWEGILLIFPGGYSYSSYPTPFASPAVFYNAYSVVLASGDVFMTIFGAACLLLLLIPQIRKSFIASMFCFLTGLVGTGGSALMWFGEAWNLLYGFAWTSSDTVRFLYYQSLLGSGVTPASIIPVLGAFMIISQFIVLLVGSKLWRSHYPEHRFSHVWFVIVVEIVWWGAFVLTGYGFQMIY